MKLANNKKDAFNNVLSFVKEIIKGENDDNKLLLIDYVMETIKKDLQYSMLTEIMYKPKWGAIDISRNTFLPDNYFDEFGKRKKCIYSEERSVDLLKDTIILVPYNIDRKKNSIINLSKLDFEYDSINHMGIYYTFIDICYVYNGIHSTSSGIELKKEGNIRVKDVVKIEELFDYVYTDGEKWYDTNLGEEIDIVIDCRLAILYEVAKIKYEIIKKSSD
ncbi:MAG: DUF6710 family protein [Clostridium sp.]|uniref:DUF6710 family protein n=1 Tax=Clostridium TaxID=1485 RepID=UPI0029022FFD|nr:DUF6710 family protein [Clostridium sp.]MDU2900488.1 DUF6710 family protein [Clostridium sp.]MDU4428229.1 DUF6710 family protein [Clostridium sp.]MDU7460902.1 DUF6710 family protein [Clostridium sp.]